MCGKSVSLEQLFGPRKNGDWFLFLIQFSESIKSTGV